MGVSGGGASLKRHGKKQQERIMRAETIKNLEVLEYDKLYTAWKTDLHSACFARSSRPTHLGQ